MITSIQTTGIAYEVDEQTRKYLNKKIGKLDRYLPRHARRSVAVDVKLQQVDHNYGRKFQAELILHVPGKNLTVHNTSTDILSAIDAIEQKVKNQLREYKQKTIKHISERGVMSQFKRSFQREL